MPQTFLSHEGSRRLALLAAFAGAGLVSSALRAEPAFTQSFDGPATSWQFLDTDVEASLLTHQIAPGGARDNAGSERVVVAASSGKSVLLACPVAHAVVIDELDVRMWVKSPRPGVQIAARVVMPRTRDSNKLSAVSTIVRGATYNRPGHWQQLALNDVPKLLAAQVRVMRSSPGVSIDPRQAFIDAAVLVIPGEPNGVEVLTDELLVDGVARPTTDAVQLASFPDGTFETSPQPEKVPLSLAADMRPKHEISNRDDNVKPTQVRLQGAVLLVDDRPFLPRVIQWHGEPIELLAKLGFNVVQLQEPPTPQQIDDAARLSMWFICVPPHPDVLARDGLGEATDRVLAWCLQDESLETDPQYARRWAELVRERDAVAGRPVIFAPESNWTAFNKIGDVLLARHPRSVSVDGLEFDQWLSDRTPIVGPGAPLWTSIATQFDEAVGRQASTLAGIPLAPPNIDARRLEALVRIACTRQVRGFVFASHSTLSETDPITRRRAATLALVNRRLQMMEPWLAAGKIIGRVSSSDAGWTGVVFHVDRARLLIPIAERAASHASARSTTLPAAEEIIFVVPGVPDSCQLFALSPAALRTLSTQRVAGGTRFTLRPEDDDLVLMTEDPQILQTLRQRIARDGQQYVRLQRDRAAMQAVALADTAQRFAQLGRKSDAAAQASANAQSQLRQIDALVASGRIEQADLLVNSVEQSLEQSFARERREAAQPTNLCSNPLALSDGQLAEYATFQSSFAELRGGDNLLYGGNFEDLGQMSQFGWRHFRSPNSDIDTRASLSAVEPQHGRFCLELHASDAAAVRASTELDTAPLWIQSPAMPVTAGQLLEITGRVRIDEPIGGSDQGLHIIDSLGGPQLALTFRQTTGWQPFQMIRAVPESSVLQLTIALTGVGTARLDAVMVRALQTPTPRRMPAADPFDDNSPDTAAPKSSGPLFIAPQSP